MTIKNWEQVSERFADVGSAQDVFYHWGGANEAIFFAVNHLRAEGYDQAMQLISMLGDRHMFPIYLLILAICAVVGTGRRMMKKQAAMRPYILRWVATFMALILGFAGYIGVVSFIKDTTQMPRPYVVYAEETKAEDPDKRVYQLEKRGEQSSYQSFPSGHVSFTTMMVAGLWPMLIYPFTWLAGACIVLVAWSRMSLGVHFPADTVGGFLITLCIMIAVHWLVRKIMWHVFKAKF
jgi:membrane-associated phospholipid phosphatase